MKVYASLYEIPRAPALGGGYVVSWIGKMHGNLVPSYQFSTFQEGLAALQMVALGSKVFSRGVPGDSFVVVYRDADFVDSVLGRRPRIAYLVQADYKSDEIEFA